MHYKFRSRNVAARRYPVFRALQNLYRSFLHENSPEGRGQSLLRQWLSQDELEAFEANGYLDVIGCHTGKRYRIYYGILANIRELDEKGRPTAGLCFAPAEVLPPGDVVLAQKIALETDELGVLAVANRFSSASRPTSSYSWRRV